MSVADELQLEKHESAVINGSHSFLFGSDTRISMIDGKAFGSSNLSNFYQLPYQVELPAGPHAVTAVLFDWMNYCQSTLEFNAEAGHNYRVTRSMLASTQALRIEDARSDKVLAEKPCIEAYWGSW
ncbi:MAG: hypothetical protein L0Y67_01425 [Gammaproteobacteria bacterium]|nr:hypothetical protein [Gammaproteobacteria bacterium]